MKNHFNIQTSITKVEKVELPFHPIIRIPIRTQAEADEYMRQGVGIYEKTTKTPNGKHSYYFIEVSVYDLAKVARKG